MEYIITKAQQQIYAAAIKKAEEGFDESNVAKISGEHLKNVLDKMTKRK